ncbi:MAG: hypothetical protein R2753_01570 [Chitinophagales bacterium]
MGLRYKLKAGGVSNLTDARYFNAMGTDWIGFNMDVLDDSSISLKEAQAIKGWLFEPNIVIECGHHQDKVELIYLANELHAAAVQIDIDHPLLEEDHFLYPIILETKFGDLQHIKLKRALRSGLDIEVILVKADEQDFNWENFKSGIKSKQKSIEKLMRDYEVIIDLPFKKEWFLEAIELLQPSGIHVQAEAEDEPGLSKVDEYDEFLSMIEVED